MYCMHCGENIPDSSKFCKYCGQRVDEDTAKVQEKAAEKAPHTETEDGFFFKGVHPIKKILMLIPAALLTLVVAAAVFVCTYPQLISEVWDTVR